MRTSIGFEILDRHVVAGAADATALVREGEHDLSFAGLLERVAALAAGLRAVGVEPGHDVHVQVEGPVAVEVACACIRIGAYPAAAGVVVVRHGDDEPEVVMDDETWSLDLVRRAGAGDPAGALRSDPDGYRERLLELVPHVVEPLLAGRPVAPS